MSNGGKHRREDGAVDHLDAAVEHPHFADQPVMLVSAAVEDPRLELARAVDDPRQPAGADVEECAEAGEQEHRRDRQLDDLRQVGESGVTRQDGAAMRADMADSNVIASAAGQSHGLPAAQCSH